MDIPLIVVLGTLGALLGSFACAQVWRLRARQLVDDKAYYEEHTTAGEILDAKEYLHPKELARLTSLLRPVTKDRSECLHCHHQLAWYDLVPVLSWLLLRGKCRYCQHPIGWAEFLSEIGLAFIFIVSYLVWPHPLAGFWTVVGFGLWLVACVIMTILLVYDAKWAYLPTLINYGLIVVGVLFRGVMWKTGVPIDWWSLLGAVTILAGLYLVFSRFGWAGDGDSTLGLGIALLLGNWELAFLTLFLANLIGSLALVPLMVKKSLHRHMRIPFGPFMIVAAIISLLWGNQLINAFLSISSAHITSLML